MGEAVPMEWIMEAEKAMDQRHRMHMDRQKKEDPEFFEQVTLKYFKHEPSRLEERDAIYDKKYLKLVNEFHEAKIKVSQKYAFTFTTNAHCDDWVATEQDMIKACHKLYSQSTCPIKQGDAYLEYTHDGRPHIHGWYQTDTGGRVYAKVFERIWKLWDEGKKQGKGFQGGFHEKVKSLNYERYASAEERKVCGKENGIFIPG